ncbi:MAG: Uma2 family endonuclease [Myxococcota bacterium]
MTEARRKATYEDLLKLPDHVVGEIVNGELVVSPRPAARHAKSATRMAASLRDFDGDEPPGGWWLLLEPELHFDEDVVVPDLAGWRRERMPEMPDVPAFTLAPDWICEVLSPRNTRHDRIAKMEVYLREEVGHAWLVDPIAETLEVYRRHGGAWLQIGRHAGDAKVRAEPFEVEEIDIGRWWLRAR